jgi:hypothetical protein
MGRLLGNPFGSISGKVGDYVYKNVNGKTIVCKLPSKRTTPRTKQELEQQSKFALIGKIAKKINSIAILKHFWKPTYNNGQSSYNAIFKNNYNLLNIKDLSGPILMAPSGGFNLNGPSIRAGKTDLLISCKSIEEYSKFNPKVEKYLCAAGIILLKSPTHEGMPIFNEIAFQSKKQLFYLNKELILDLGLTGAPLLLFQEYSIKKVYAVFVTMDENENPVQHSATFENEE